VVLAVSVEFVVQVVPAEAVVALTVVFVAAAEPLWHPMQLVPSLLAQPVQVALVVGSCCP